MNLTNLSNAGLEDVAFNGSDFRPHVNAQTGKVTPTNLTGARLPDTNLESAQLNGTILNNVRAEDIRLSGANLSPFIAPNGTKFVTELNNANLASADFGPVLDPLGNIVTRSNLTEIQARNLFAERVDLSYSILTGANLSSARYAHRC